MPYYVTNDESLDALKMRLWKRKQQASNKNSGTETFHNSIRWTLILGQIFALIPVNGINSAREDRLYFSWKSWKVWYTFILITCLCIPMYASIHEIFVTKATIEKITAVVFFANSITVHVLFVELARNWPKLMRNWHTMEKAMNSYGWPRWMNLRMKMMTITMLSIATIEHVLSIIGHFIIASELKSEDQDIFEYFFVVIAFPEVFAIIKYSIWLGTLMQVITFASTFSWTYIDLFISLMGVGLALRFQQIANRIELYAEEKVSNEILWKEIREDYVRLCILCRKLNDNLSNLIVISFASNLFYVLVQLYHSLKYVESAVEKIYFFFSFGFLMGRTLCVCLYGAWIGEESQRPLLSLNSVSSNAYSVEIRRFILHICFNPPSLSGKHFFFITRGLVLSIAGTIMTYELVLIQAFGVSRLEANGTRT